MRKLIAAGFIGSLLLHGCSTQNEAPPRSNPGASAVSETERPAPNATNPGQPGPGGTRTDQPGSAGKGQP